MGNHTKSRKIQYGPVQCGSFVWIKHNMELQLCSPPTAWELTSVLLNAVMYYTILPRTQVLYVCTPTYSDYISLGIFTICWDSLS